MKRNSGRMRTLLCALGIAITARAQVHTVANFPGGVDSIIQGSDGNFYGTTSSDGAFACQSPFGPTGCGRIFKVTPQGVVSTLYSFPAGPNSIAPLPNPLVQGTDGNFYGITIDGGTGSCTYPFYDATGCGTVFKITPQGSLTIIYKFDVAHGTYPTALIKSADGNFYGTTAAGGIADGSAPYG